MSKFENDDIIYKECKVPIEVIYRSRRDTWGQKVDLTVLRCPKCKKEAEF